MSFDFDSKVRRDLGYKLIDHIDDYFSSLSDRPVQLPAAARKLPALPHTMPEMGGDPDTILEELCHTMMDKGFHVPSANYLGLMNPTPTYMSVLAETLVSTLNPQLASVARSHLASKIEHDTMRWIGDLVGWTSNFGGTFTTGGTEANLSGLALALAWKFPNIVDEGVASLGGSPVFYASSEAHHSLDKAAALLGLGRKALRRIPVNENAEIDIYELEQAILQDLDAGHKPFAVVATAGTTNSGAIDDIQAVASICQQHSLWLHTDGAYGAAVLISDTARDLVRGIDLSDSVTIDPHKWLAMPFASGLILTRYPELLEPTFGTTTAYMPKISNTVLQDNYKISAQWSRRMNSLKLWLTLRVHGRKAFQQLIDDQLRLATSFAEQIVRDGYFELAGPVRLPILTLRIKADHMTDEAIDALNVAAVDYVNEDGQQWISTTSVRGRTVIRLMIISYLSEQRHLDKLANKLSEAAAVLQEAKQYS